MVVLGALVVMTGGGGGTGAGGTMSPGCEDRLSSSGAEVLRGCGGGGGGICTPRRGMTAGELFR